MPQIKPCHDGDLFLIDVFVALNLAPEDLITLNEVRMYKKVSRLSDITSADGTLLIELYLTSASPSHKTTFEWPRCQRPTPNHIALWKDTVVLSFIGPHAQHR
jgi:hypothetical protein